MSRAPWKGVVGSLAVLAVTAGLGTTVAAGSASSASTSDCPAAASSVTPGEAVHGLTVSSGTTPDPFTGQVIGTLTDGIAPGVDLIMVDLTSPAIDQAGGVWGGMSGSPVYDGSGNLVGAVSYGLSWGASTVAGLTPASEMQKLFTEDASGAARAARRVTLGKRLAARVVATGDATARQVAAGYAPLELPTVISGMQSPSRVHDLAVALGFTGRVLSGSAADAAAPEYSVVTGGNLGVDVSYGLVSSYAYGTATEVCNGQVIGFGHPFTYRGATSLSMHGAYSLYVQKDPLGTPYKVVNLGAPVGTITGDHLAGVFGTVGATLQSDIATSKATFGSRSRHGTTYITLPEATPDLAPATMWTAQDRAMDYAGPGSATASWTIKGIREDGRSFSVSRADVFTSPYDIAYESASELGTELYQIWQSENLRITSVNTDSTISRQTGQYRIQRVQVRSGGGWQTVHNGQPVTVRAGTTRQLRVALTSASYGARTVIVGLAVPAGTAGASGDLRVYGGLEVAQSGDVYGDGGGGQSLDAVLRQIRTRPHRDEVVAEATIAPEAGKARTLHAATATGHVVSGFRSFALRVVR
ncbi:MAG TPA: hypothetical protein VFM09_03845 [Marmoricola sp.]|nr:hypothetical protein [Marmoricola sp.]